MFHVNKFNNNMDETISNPHLAETSKSLYFNRNKRLAETLQEDHTCSLNNNQFCDNTLSDSHMSSTSVDRNASNHASKRLMRDVENEKEANSMEKTQRVVEKRDKYSETTLRKHVKQRVPFVQCDQNGFVYSAELQNARLKWNLQDEIIKVKEDMEWLYNKHACTLLLSNLRCWLKLGCEREIVGLTFCNSEIQNELIRLETMLDSLDKEKISEAMARSNLYGTIRKEGFHNCTAVKMANIDAACDFMFTNWPNRNGLIYFADVCAGPGGFSEYILSRKRWHAKGFGFTLRYKNNFQLNKFLAGPYETLHPFYGEKDNGNVCDLANQTNFYRIIMKHTYNKGVHFMMSDGSCSIQGEESTEEITSKQLYLCQCRIALMVVRTGGHFVTKLFNLFTPFSVGLIYLMYKCFDSICIFKPNTSKPTTSERYLVCKGKKANTDETMHYLGEAIAAMLRISSRNDQNKKVIQLVPLSVLNADTLFIKYLKNSNNTLGKRQILNLLKIIAFYENPSLVEPKQDMLRNECLKHWNLSDKRIQPYNPLNKIQEIWNFADFLKHDAQKLTKEILGTTIFNQPFDWFWIPCGSGHIDEDKPTFYISMGKRKVFRYVKENWELVRNVRLELPPNTIVYAELVREVTWMGRNFAESRALHILDAYMLGGQYISTLYITDRHELIKKFCNALWKFSDDLRRPTPSKYVCVRPKQIFLFNPNEVGRQMRSTQNKVKNMSNPFEIPKNPLEFVFEGDANLIYFQLKSVLFLRNIARPWTRHVSKKTNCTYVFNPEKNITEYENCRPSDASASFKEAFHGRLVWHWPQDDTLNLKTLLEMYRETQPNTS